MRHNHVHVTVAEKPSCQSTVTEAREGDSANLSCRMLFSGTPKSPPSISWYSGDGQTMDDDDNSDVGVAQGDVTRTLTTDDDRRPFRCVATLGDVDQHCDVVLQVRREFTPSRFNSASRGSVAIWWVDGCVTEFLKRSRLYL